MKRHLALQQLSREHHQALKLARLANFAADSGSLPAIAQAAATIAERFPDVLEPHFRTEEADLLPALSASGKRALVERTLADHSELRRLNRQLATPDGATLARFGQLLHDHVRFEERELFETLQTLLYPES